jgi:zinc-binding alcohol dehydrogenase family protein
VKAIGFDRHGGPEVLAFHDVEPPRSRPRDLVVSVRAAGVNPVDAKVRAGTRPSPASPPGPVIPGWDAAGVVEETGVEARAFRVGDEVWFAGDRMRQGAYAERVAVDERIVARKPRSLSFEDAAAVPLAAITAWEALFEHLGLGEGREEGRTLLVLGGAGGVGSIAIQLAKALTRARVVASASRPESERWCRAMGADAVVDHRRRLAPQLVDGAAPGVDFVLSCADPLDVENVAEATRPLGRVCSILPVRGLDLTPFFPRRLTLSFELMFARTLYDLEPERHGSLLARVASLYDEGRLRPTRKRTLPWDRAREAHEAIESGHTVGKIVLRLP